MPGRIVILAAAILAATAFGAKRRNACADALLFNDSVTHFYETVFDHGEPSPEDFQAALRDAEAAIRGKRIGEGVNAYVLASDEGFAYKIAIEWESMPALMVESRLAENLAAWAPDLKPHVVPYAAVGTLGCYLKRPLLPAAGLATNIPDLSAKQTRELEVLFEKARKFALDTGIALDLKAHNLFWNGKVWQLFDLGARRSYRPYGYTSDLPDFATYLRVWREEEPPDLPGLRYTDDLR